MTPSLIPLTPRTLEFRRRPFRLLKDRHLFDTEDVATTDTSQEFFVSAAGKRKSQAIFAGDQSLVKEANCFLVVALQAVVRNRRLEESEWLVFHNYGYFVFSVTVPESVTVDEDRIAHIAPGPNYEQFLNTTNDAVAAGREYSSRRTYLVGENKVVPGGRAVEFVLNWSEAGVGNGLNSTASVSIVLAGAEYEPGA